MDGFRERLGGRYDRGDRSPRNDRYEDRYDDRYEDRYERPVEDRFERSPRRDSVSIDAINDAIDSSNRDQLEVIMDMFDEAKADRRESEKAIIETISSKIAANNVVTPEEVVTNAEPVVAADNETLSRIERMASQNAETLSESSEMLERSVNSLRSNTELLNDIKGSLDAMQTMSEDIKYSNQMVQQSIMEMSNSQNQMAPSYGESVGSEEILNAVGDNRTLLNMIRQDIITRFDNSNTDTEESDEASEVKPLSAEVADKYYKELEDHVHKECVKCYRNVQSTLQDQNAESLAKTEKSIAGVHTLAVVSIALNVVTIVLIVCNILGIL